MKELIDEISVMMETFRENARNQLDKGNKSAGLRARRASLDLDRCRNVSASCRWQPQIRTSLNDPAMRLTPLQENMKRLDRTLPSENKKVAQWVIDNARPHIAIRQNNMVTVCFCCGNAMMYAGSTRYAKCLECGCTVEIIEEQDWLESKRMVS